MLSDWAGMMNGLANCGFPVKTPQEGVNVSNDEEDRDGDNSDDGEIVDPFGTGDPDEMAHSQHGYGREM